MKVSKGVLAVLVTVLILVSGASALILTKNFGNTPPQQPQQPANAKEISRELYLSKENITGTVPELNKTLKYAVDIKVYLGGQPVEMSTLVIADYGKAIKESIHQIIIQGNQQAETKFDAIVFFDQMYVHDYFSDKYFLVEGTDAAREFQTRVSHRDVLVSILKSGNPTNEQILELAKTFVVGDITEVKLEKFKVSEDTFTIEFSGKMNTNIGRMDFEISIIGSLE